MAHLLNQNLHRLMDDGPSCATWLKGKLTFLLSDSWVRWGRRQLAGSYQAQIPPSWSHSGVLLKRRSQKWPQTFNHRCPSAAAKSRSIMSLKKGYLFQAAFEWFLMTLNWSFTISLAKMLFCVAIWELVASLPVPTSTPCCRCPIQYDPICYCVPLTRVPFWIQQHSPQLFMIVHLPALSNFLLYLLLKLCIFTHCGSVTVLLVLLLL